MDDGADDLDVVVKCVGADEDVHDKESAVGGAGCDVGGCWNRVVQVVDGWVLAGHVDLCSRCVVTEGCGRAGLRVGL